MEKIERTKDKIRRIRLEKGLTQKQLAERCNMYESQIRKYETGKANPKTATLEKIAAALSVPVTSLYSDTSIVLKQIEQATLAAMDILETNYTNECNLLELYRDLNRKGQEKALEQVEMLTKIPEYRKTDTPEE